MAGRREWIGRMARLALFAAVAGGAIAFVLYTRGNELGPPPQNTTTSQKSASQTTRQSTSATTSESTSQGGYYILFRLARQRAEAQEEAVLRTIVSDAEASASDRAKASDELEALARAAREEGEVESILASQGFPSSAVVISNGSAMVIVPAAQMSDSTAARIGTDLWNLADIPPEQVLIRPRA
jgi:hypothetical protein